MFSEHVPKEFFDCTAIVITKSPDIKSDKLDLLVKKFEGCNKKANDHHTEKINLWLESLKNRNAFFLFKKFVDEETTQK